MEIKPLFTPEQAQQLSDALDKFISVARDNLQSNIRAAFPFMFEGNSSELFDTSAVEDLIRVTNTEGDTVAEYDDARVRITSDPEYDEVELRDGADNVLARERTNRATGETERVVGDRPFGPGRCQSGGFGSDYDIYSDGTLPVNVRAGGGETPTHMSGSGGSSDYNIYSDTLGPYSEPGTYQAVVRTPVNGDTMASEAQDLGDMPPMPREHEEHLHLQTVHPRLQRMLKRGQGLLLEIPIQLENGPVTFHALGDDGIVHLNERSLDRIYGAFARQEGELHPIARRALEPLAAVAAELKRMSDDCGNALTHVLTGEQRTKLVERREAYDTAARMIERAMSDVR